MRLTIIETGLPPEAIRAFYPGGYPVMFEALLEGADPTLTFETVSLIGGEDLPDPETLEAILITGSAYGVYDDVSWMRPLKEWIGFAAEHQVPMIGVCFGHQVIADALGGDVRKSDRGWGIGRHTYQIERRPYWLKPDAERFSVGVSHQDQVLVPPVGADVLAGNEFAPNAALVYSRAPIISFQCHPEFSDGFLQDLYMARKDNPLSETRIEEALASFRLADDNALVAQWMVSFLQSATNGRW